MRLHVSRWPESPHNRFDARIGFTYGIFGEGRVLALYIGPWRCSLSWFRRGSGPCARK